MDKLIQDFSYGLFIWQVLVFRIVDFLIKKVRMEANFRRR